jgi:hypothetical protein
MRLKTKKRYNRKKTYKRHNHKRRVQTKKRCHRGGGGPEDNYVDFIDADHSGGIHVRYNESVPDKMWLIGPSSWLWTFRTLSEGVGMRGKNGRYKPFIDAWNQDARAQGTAITTADFLYPKEDVDSSYGMVISDDQFERIFIVGALSILYSGLGAKYMKLKMADEDNAVLVEYGPSERNSSLNPFITPTPDGPFEKKSLASFFAPGPAPTHVPSTHVPTSQPAPQLDLTLVPSMPLDVSSDDATALVSASLAEIRAIRQDKDNESQFRNLKNFDEKLSRLGYKLLHIFGPNCTNYHEFEVDLYNPSNDPNDPLYFEMFSDTHVKSEYTKFLDGQKSLLMMWANKSLECTSESPQSNQFIGTRFDTSGPYTSVPYIQFQRSFQKFAKRALLLMVHTDTLSTLRLKDNHTIIKVADDGWCFYRAVLVAMGTPDDAIAIRTLREFALAISWIIVNVCPEPPVVLIDFGVVDMNELIENYPVNSSSMNITAMELVKLISVPKLSDIFKPCLYPVLRYNIGQIAAMILGKNIFILNDSLTSCEEQYCGTDSIAPEDQIFMRNTNRNHFDVIQLSTGVGPIVTVADES